MKKSTSKWRRRRVCVCPRLVYSDSLSNLHGNLAAEESLELQRKPSSTPTIYDDLAHREKEKMRREKEAGRSSWLSCPDLQWTDAA